MVQFFQRNSLPSELLNKETANQKLDYIPARLCHSGGHNNPNAGHWKLFTALIEYIFLFSKRTLLLILITDIITLIYDNYTRSFTC